jgi:hypothetical protein
MPKATTKAGLIQAANDNFDKLFKMIDSMTEAEQTADFTFNTEALTAKDNAGHWKRDKNLRDTLAHLYEWHQLLLNWERANMGGENAPFLLPPYTWKTYMEMNIGFWEKHQSLNWSLSEAKVRLNESHSAVVGMIGKHTDEELFIKAHYKWTGTSSLGQYCHSATVAHYDWAMKKLKEQIKMRTK